MKSRAGWLLQSPALSGWKPCVTLRARVVRPARAAVMRCLMVSELEPGPEFGRYLLFPCVLMIWL